MKLIALWEVEIILFEGVMEWSFILIWNKVLVYVKGLDLRFDFLLFDILTRMFFVVAFIEGDEWEFAFFCDWIEMRERIFASI